MGELSTFDKLYEARLGPKIMQDREELRGLYQFFCKKEIRTYLEIGARSGGSFSVLARACEPGAMVIALDLPGGLWGTESSLQDLLEVHKSLIQEKYDSYVVLGDSHLYRNWKIVSEGILQGRLLDAILIDGDHTYEGCRRDVLDYSVFLRKGGYVILHDIDPEAPPHPKGPKIGVSRVWKELLQICSTKSYKTPGSKMGIGIAKVVDRVEF